MLRVAPWVALGSALKNDVGVRLAVSTMVPLEIPIEPLALALLIDKKISIGPVVGSKPLR